ncbi:hypothetical protein WJ542_22030 [Paraburkholderia sp. B3]|uniref:hypothetical protein n=1 Tax=Paraburkholderia sp. B3 TaxID=3134791 RepID=UPI0039825D1E
MPDIESSNVRVDHGADSGSASPAENLPREPQATATSGAAGETMNGLMTLRRQRPAAGQAATFVPDGGTPQKPEGKLSRMRQALEGNAAQALPQLMQTSLDMQRNRMQILQQTSAQMGQLTDSLAEGIEKAAR